MKSKRLLTLCGLAVMSMLAGLTCLSESSSAGDPKPAKKVSKSGKVAVAIFAGGCFWCMEPPFDKVEGVLATISGYAGGPEKNPSYKQVASGQTGHTEVVKVEFDPDAVSYEKLLDVFWMSHDPTDKGGQFVDRGTQYRPAIFYLDEGQKKAAIASRDKLTKSKRFEDPIQTEITKAGDFWPAEDYHQNFYKKSPTRYYGYRAGSGRDRFLEGVWGKAK